MFCGKCGAEVLDGAKFCDKCGAVIEVEQVDVKQKEEKVDVKSVFIDPEEQLVAKVGNGYLVNLLYNRVKKCNLLLSDKRVYLKGTFYSDDGKGITKMNAERIVDIEDITGTGFIYRSFSWILLMLDILCIIVSLAITLVPYFRLAGYGILNSLIWATPYMTITIPTVAIELLLMKKILMSRKVHFFIDYAGGRIMIDAKLIGIEDVRDFHKQMRRVKDNIKGKIS